MEVYKFPDQVPELFQQINDFLSAIVCTRDDMFGFRFSNLFRAIDFGKYFLFLQTVTNAIEELEVWLFQNSAFWKSKIKVEEFELVVTYLSKIKVASGKLRDIAGRLELKTKGQPYRYRDYQTDLLQYNKSVDAYSVLGNQMNVLFRSFDQ